MFINHSFEIIFNKNEFFKSHFLSNKTKVGRCVIKSTISKIEYHIN